MPSFLLNLVGTVAVPAPAPSSRRGGTCALPGTCGRPLVEDRSVTVIVWRVSPVKPSPQHDEVVLRTMGVPGRARVPPLRRRRVCCAADPILAPASAIPPHLPCAERDRPPSTRAPVTSVAPRRAGDRKSISIRARTISTSSASVFRHPHSEKPRECRLFDQVHRRESSFPHPMPCVRRASIGRQQSRR